VNVQGKNGVFKAADATFFYCRKLILNSVSEIIMPVLWICFNWTCSLTFSKKHSQETSASEMSVPS